ncbi:MAG: 16S rRNA (uracil(1498)-N(3))-methyltransferase [Candidatus Hydrogenedentes bacterium]|nr:16S rRNA (uracil(1498)-N(3))-methyltransferase [Candidatus Hydrogenedentota bacterium]
MSHLHRFYVPGLADNASTLTLTGAEAHHALRVVRLAHGQKVAVFDGRGRECFGTVNRATRRELEIEITERHVEPEPAYRLTLMQAWLHHSRAIEESVRHGTEIGVTDFCFFRAAQSERAPDLKDKLQRIAIETCKQCGRLWLPRFESAPNLTDALEASRGALLVATRDIPGISLKEAIQDHSHVTLVVGPEGDFTAEELQHILSRGARPISLGRTTFRSETAAILGATLILYELGLFNSNQDS